MFLDDGELARALLEQERPSRGRVLSVGAALLVHLVPLLLISLGLFRAAQEPEEPVIATQLVESVPEPYVDPDSDPARFYDLPPRAPEPPRPDAVRSDADRRAHGGDPARPPTETPFDPGDARPPGGQTQAAPSEPREEVAESDGPTQPRAPSLLALRRESEGRDAPTPDLSRSLGPPPVPPRPAAGAGQGGSPDADDPDAGFVDQEGLSFDTKWFDWGPYGAEMVRMIKQNWRIPGLAQVGMKGIVTIRFTILADGSIVDEKIVKSSGIPPFDAAAFQAIADAAPFPPLPAELGSDHEGVTVRFFYNIRPPDRT